MAQARGRLRGRPTVKRGAPRGATEVRQSLIEAATQLFASRGPAKVSVREIAESAGVNHGLVHHYFGSKDGLLRAVLDTLAHQAATEIAEWDRDEVVFSPGGATERHGRIVAHLLLESREPAGVQTDFPAMHALVNELRRRGFEDRKARERAAQVTSLVLGWQLFEPFVMAAAGLDAPEDPDARLLADAIDRLLTPAPDATW